EEPSLSGMAIDASSSAQRLLRGGDVVAHREAGPLPARRPRGGHHAPTLELPRLVPFEEEGMNLAEAFALRKGLLERPQSGLDLHGTVDLRHPIAVVVGHRALELFPGGA